MDHIRGHVPSGSRTHTARVLWNFLGKYVDLYEENGGARCFLELDSGGDATTAFTAVASRFIWGRYSLQMDRAMQQLSLQAHRLGDAYSYNYRHLLSESLLERAVESPRASADWIVDVGGSESWYMDAVEAGKVVVIDPMASATPGTAQREHIHWVRGCGESLPLPDNSAVLVACLEVLEHLPSDSSRRDLLNEVFRVLDRSGVLLLSTPQTDDLIGILKLKITGDPDFRHHGVWSWDRTRRELQAAGFRIEKAWGTALDLRFLNSYLWRHPRWIIPLHLLNVAMDWAPLGRRLKFQSIVWCTPSVDLAG